MSEDYLVERAGPAHCAAMGRLWARLIELMVEIDPEQYQPVPWEGLAGYLREQLESDQLVGFVACADGNVVGFLYGVTVARPPLFKTRRIAAIEELFVDPSHRSRRIGAALVRAFEHWAQGEGLRQIELSAHLRNPSAQGFWEREGYAAYADFRRRELQNQPDPT